MNLAYKKILGKFTKVLGFGKTPPHVGKNSQMISFFLFDSVPKKTHTSFFQENEHQLCSELHDRHQVRAQLIKDETRVCFYKTVVLLWRVSTNYHCAGVSFMSSVVKIFFEFC